MTETDKKTWSTREETLNSKIIDLDLCLFPNHIADPYKALVLIKECLILLHQLRFQDKKCNLAADHDES